MTELRDMRREPGESWESWVARTTAAESEHLRKQREAYRPPSADGPSIDLACGVGCYDLNGNPKGSGWW